jgi:phospholipase/carboxylesterase
MTRAAISLEHVHADGRIAHAGEPTTNPVRAMIMVHGRGATPESILGLADGLPGDLGFTFVAPGASESTVHPRSWYPHSFLAPVEANEPGLSSGLANVADTVSQLETGGIEPRHIILPGFPQGACLVTEFIARNPRRWGGAAALTGGLIGERVEPSNYQGDLEGTEVLHRFTAWVEDDAVWIDGAEVADLAGVAYAADSPA